MYNNARDDLDVTLFGFAFSRFHLALGELEFSIDTVIVTTGRYVGTAYTRDSSY